MSMISLNSVVKVVFNNENEHDVLVNLMSIEHGFVCAVKKQSEGNKPVILFIPQTSILYLEEVECGETEVDLPTIP